jgi:hypothetical protein
MKPSILATAFLASLALISAPLHAQRVSAEVVVHGGPVTGHVIVGDRYSTYRGRPVLVHRARRIMVLERHGPRVILVERFRHRHAKHWKRGFRPIVVYYVDGRYYDRFDPSHSGVREVVVYERGGRYYRDGDDYRIRRYGDGDDDGDWDDDDDRDD